MVEFALHCGAYPLCQVCVGNPAHQLLGKKSSQLAALSETWRCLFSTEILCCELVHRKARVLQLQLLVVRHCWASWPSCPGSPQVTVWVRGGAAALICVPGASSGSSTGQTFLTADICARRVKSLCWHWGLVLCGSGMPDAFLFSYEESFELPLNME